MTEFTFNDENKVRRKLYNHQSDYKDNEFNNTNFINNWFQYTSNSSSYRRPLETLSTSYDYMNGIYLSIILQNIIIPYLTFDTINLTATFDSSYIRWEFIISAISFVLISFILKSFKYTFIIFITILQLSPIIKNLNKTTDFNTIVNISYWLSIIIIFLKSITKTNISSNSQKLTFKQVLVINLQLTNIIIMSSRFNKLIQVAIYLLINIQLQILIPLKYSNETWFKRVNYALLFLILGVNSKFRHINQDYNWIYIDYSRILYALLGITILNLIVYLKYSFTNHIIKNKMDKKNIPFFQSWEIKLPST